MIRKLTQTLAGAVAMLCVVSTLALAEGMTCAQDDGKNCTMAKNADGEEIMVMVPGAKGGDKLDCTDKDDGTMTCKKAVMMKK
jgi:hypothetical protein